jgi:hypothetical protein
MVLNEHELINTVSNTPQFNDAVNLMQQQTSSIPITPDGIEELIGMLKFMLSHPDQYSAIREAAIRDDYIDPDQLPDQFDVAVISALLASLVALQKRLSETQNFAHGGLAEAGRKIASHGRGGDTMLAHINPREAQILSHLGGGGTINPHTGLPEYFSLKSFLGAVLPIALNFIVPGAGAALGATLGASGIGASLLGNALIGGASSALSGGNALQGALLGGIGGGLNNAIGSSINNSLGLNLGANSQNLLGAAVTGGASGAATGKGFLAGATQGALGQMAGNTISGLGGSPDSGFIQGGKVFGDMLNAGYNAKESALAGGLSGLASSLNKPVSDANIGLSPSKLAVDGLKIDSSIGLKAPEGTFNLQSSGNNPFSLKNGIALATIGNMFSGPQDQQNQIPINGMSEEQKEYFNRPSVNLNWDRLQDEASQNGMDLNSYISRNWNRVASGDYNVEVPRKFSKGGALQRASRLMIGNGSGRADTINAKLSDGEYVIDAETVALLGDGSASEGAKKLDEMRKSIRSHKGKILAKGGISPNAKSPLAYLKGI